MSITRVGLGAWAIGGGGWAYSLGPQDDRDSIATIRHAVANGINWIDTAAVYGLGHSEEVIAAALQDIPERERPYVFTKAGLVWRDRDPAAEPRKIGDPRSIRREIAGSLRRLGTDCIDLYQMHWTPQDGTPLEAYGQTLLDLRTEGKARAVGLSNHDVAQLEAAEQLGHVDSLQPVFTAIHRQAAADVVPWCTEHGTGVISTARWRPVCSAGASRPNERRRWTAPTGGGPCTRTSPARQSRLRGRSRSPSAGSGPALPPHERQGA